MYRVRGYTLVEMIIVIAVLGLIARAAFPRAGPLGTAKLDAGAQEVANALRFARSEAMRTNSFYGVDFSNDASGKARIRVFHTDSAIPANPVYDVYHPVDKKLWDLQLASNGPTANVVVSQATFYYKTGSTVSSTSWAAFDGTGTPEYYPNAASYAAYSSASQTSAVTVSHQGKTMQIALDPVTGRVTVQ